MKFFVLAGSVRLCFLHTRVYLCSASIKLSRTRLYTMSSSSIGLTVLTMGTHPRRSYTSSNAMYVSSRPRLMVLLCAPYMWYCCSYVSLSTIILYWRTRPRPSWYAGMPARSISSFSSAVSALLATSCMVPKHSSILVTSVDKLTVVFNTL